MPLYPLRSSVVWFAIALLMSALVRMIGLGDVSIKFEPCHYVTCNLVRSGKCHNLAKMTQNPMQTIHGTNATSSLLRRQCCLVPCDHTDPYWVDVLPPSLARAIRISSVFACSLECPGH